MKRKEDAEAQRLKNLVTTYENMKASQRYLKFSASSHLS
jgi:hypothetical protein